MDKAKNKTTKVTLVNDFHGTTCAIRLKRGDNTLSKGQYNRVWYELCGMTDCHCGGNPTTETLEGYLVDFSVHLGYETYVISDKTGKVL